MCRRVIGRAHILRRWQGLNGFDASGRSAALAPRDQAITACTAMTAKSARHKSHLGEILETSELPRLLQGSASLALDGLLHRARLPRPDASEVELFEVAAGVATTNQKTSREGAQAVKSFVAIIIRFLFSRRMFCSSGVDASF